jgi:tetratricopeptide (TPR) repeat protein
MHYLIHANDVPGRERESPDVTAGYAAVAPHNPHALHMPTHIYTRLGDWPAVIRGNLAAADAALDFPAGDRQQFVWDEFPHAIEYLVYALLQRGADDSAAAEIARLDGVGNLEPTFKTAFHLASTRTRYALERQDWHAAAAITPREPASLDWDRFAWPEAIARFGRGLGLAHLGHADAADSEATRLGLMETATRAGGEEIFARNIGMLRLELLGWIAQARGHGDSAVTLVKAAADLEEATPKHAVTPGPTLPASELLGDLYLAQHHPAAALSAYRHSLELYPRRFNSLIGAAQAARQGGDADLARTFYRELVAVADPASRRSGIEEARKFLEVRSEK